MAHQIVPGSMPAGDGTIPNPGRSNNFDGNNSNQFSSGHGLLAKHPDGRIAIVGGFWTDSSNANFPNFFNSNTVQVSTDSLLTSWNTFHDTDFDPLSITHNAFGACQNVVMSVSGGNDILITIVGLDHAIRFNWNTGIFTNTAIVGGLTTLRGDVVPIQLLDGRIFVGTASDGYCYLYHPDTDSWEFFASFLGDHTGGASALLSDGNVLLIGGNPSSPGNKVEVLNVGTLAWTTVFGGLLTNRQLFSFTPLGSDNFLIAGGLNSVSASLTAAEVFTYTNTPSISGFLNATGSLTVQRYGPMPSFLLPDGVTAAVFGGIFGPTFAALDSIELFDGSAGFPWTSGTWSTDNAVLSQPDMGMGGLLISSSPMKFWMPGGETFDAGVLTFDRIVQTADVWEVAVPSTANVHFSWTSVTDASTYNLYYRNAPGVTTGNSTAVTGLTGTSTTIAFNLDTLIYSRVNAENASTITTGLSNEAFIIAEPPDATIFNVVSDSGSGIVATSPLDGVWTNHTGLDGYTGSSFWTDGDGYVWATLPESDSYAHWDGYTWSINTFPLVLPVPNFISTNVFWNSVHGSGNTIYFVGGFSFRFFSGEGFVTDHNPLIVFTTDRGATWNEDSYAEAVLGPVNATIAERVFVTSPTDIWITGDNLQTPAPTLIHGDIFDNWTVNALSGFNTVTYPNSIFGLWASDAYNVYLGPSWGATDAYAGVYHSTNAGSTWSFETFGLTPNTNLQGIQDIKGTSSTDIWAITTATASSQLFVMKSNGSSTWTSDTPTGMVPADVFNSLYVRDRHVYVAATTQTFHLLRGTDTWLSEIVNNSPLYPSVFTGVLL